MCSDPTQDTLHVGVVFVELQQRCCPTHRTRTGRYSADYCSAQKKENNDKKSTILNNIFTRCIHFSPENMGL